MATAPDIRQLKSNLKAVWMAGDFGQIATYTQEAAAEFVRRTAIQRGSRILDVACGTGNVSIPAARAGARVTGVDIATNLLDQARRRASREGLNIDFEEGDAEALPYPDGSFDVVLSMFGAMFAPRPERVAAELIRVVKPGGLIRMANWTPQGFVGRSFQLTAKFVPPPAEMAAPTLWGDEATLRQRLASGIRELNMIRQHAIVCYPFPPRGVVKLFREYFGPTQATFARLDAREQRALASELEALWMEQNKATDGTTRVELEYLEVTAMRA
jgi:SAM-dependent methyltransferase